MVVEIRKKDAWNENTRKPKQAEEKNRKLVTGWVWSEEGVG